MQGMQQYLYRSIQFEWIYNPLASSLAHCRMANYIDLLDWDHLCLCHIAPIDFSTYHEESGPSQRLRSAIPYFTCS